MLKSEPLRLEPSKENLSLLLAEQIEYSDVVLLNKTDLIDEAQLENIRDRVTLLNPDAKLIPCRHSQIPVMEVVDTRLHDLDAYNERLTRLAGGFDGNSQAVKLELVQESCCAAKEAEGKDPCCDTEARPRSVESGVSKVVLPMASKTRHSSRFGISSFLYLARRPFHPERFAQAFVHKFFVYQDDDPGRQGNQESGIANDDEETSEPKRTPEEFQRMALDREKIRTEQLGQVIRSKGFLWLADMHDLVGTFSHAGNLVVLDSHGPWATLESKAYRGTQEEKSKLRKDWVAPWGDRRQELVFIGQNLDHASIQGVLDECLLSDEELEMGVDYWKATMGDVVLAIEPEESSLS